MGLGGAFAALADDATAAFANPAGLVQLTRPEVSLEYRLRDYSTPYTAGGRVLGEPTGNGIDTVDGLRISSSDESTSGISFASFVYPGTRWSVALFRHQLAEYRIVTEINGLFGESPEGGTRRYLDQLAATEFDIAGTGLSGAFRVSERVSFGFGITYFTGRLDSQADVHSVDVFPETLWETNSFLEHRRIVTNTFTVDDHDLAFNLGFLWRFADCWNLGGVFRQGPRFDYELINRAGPLNPDPEGTIIGSVTDRSIAFPDVWGLGVAYRSPNGSLTVGFEWDRVEYSTVLETLESESVDTSDVDLQDGDELRVGVEYVFLRTRPLVAVRGGIWRDPKHRFEYSGDDPFSQALYQPGKDTVHLSVGAGVALKNFQIDLGADLSDLADSYALSAIYSF